MSSGFSSKEVSNYINKGNNREVIRRTISTLLSEQEVKRPDKYAVSLQEARMRKGDNRGYMGDQKVMSKEDCSKQEWF